MKLSNKLLIAFCLVPYGLSLQAQNAIPASGGNATGSGGSASYTVGQVVYNTNVGTNGSEAQGVQQPYEISIVTAVEEAKDINLIYSVYPNPTTDFLILKIGNYDKVNLSYWLYNVNGNLIDTKKVLSNETQISMANKVSGTYLLKITSGSTELKTFKIVKH